MTEVDNTEQGNDTINDSSDSNTHTDDITITTDSTDVITLTTSSPPNLSVMRLSDTAHQVTKTARTSKTTNSIKFANSTKKPRTYSKHKSSARKELSPEKRQIWSTGQIAKHIGVSDKCVVEYANRGELKCFKIGVQGHRRVQRIDLENFLKERGLPQLPGEQVSLSLKAKPDKPTNLLVNLPENFTNHPKDYLKVTSFGAGGYLALNYIKKVFIWAGYGYGEAISLVNEIKKCYPKVETTLVVFDDFNSRQDSYNGKTLYNYEFESLMSEIC